MGRSDAFVLTTQNQVVKMLICYTSPTITTASEALRRDKHVSGQVHLFHSNSHTSGALLYDFLSHLWP